MTSPLSPDQIAELVQRSGHHHVVAAIANCKDPSAVVRWITNEAVPSPSELEGLAFACKWSDMISCDQTFRLLLDVPVPLPKHPVRVSAATAIGMGAFDVVTTSARHIYRRQ